MPLAFRAYFLVSNIASAYHEAGRDSHALILGVRGAGRRPSSWSASSLERFSGDMSMPLGPQGAWEPSKGSFEDANKLGLQRHACDRSMSDFGLEA